jgi:hypothetical protein
MIKAVLFILSPFLLIYPKYDKIFSYGYDDALIYLKKNREIINQVFNEDNDEKSIMLSVVFPEIVKYSFLIDYFQKTATELIYIKYGKEKADYSIGRFQMKPSFIEKLESYIRKSPALSDEYSGIIYYSTDDKRDIRKIRMQRLNTLEWQLYYLKCFFAIMNEKFGHIQWNNKTAKIRFYAAAYNHDFYHANKKEIERWIDRRTFPYGVNSDKEQYAYSKISAYFYKKHWPEIQKHFNSKPKEVLSKK